MLKVLLIIISVNSFCYINGQTCHYTAPPLRFDLGTWKSNQPISYNGMSLLPTSQHGCQFEIRGHFFICSNVSYMVILGDGAMVPSPPNLTSSTYLRHFFVWNRNMISSFIEFDWGELQDNVTAIELSFLNSPVNGISLPDIAITALMYGSSRPLSFRLRQNQNLSLSDDQVMTVFIQPLTQKLSFTALKIFFRFTIFHDFDWIFVSEIKFCTGTQLSFSPLLTFSEPSSNIVQPSANDLRRGSTELVCTVSNEGSYTWQWERDNSSIGNSGDFRITIGDGSRTTRLTISNLDFSDAGEYSCTATTLDGIFTNSTIQTVQFPELIVTTPNVTRQQTEEVTLICVHYRNNSFTSPVWLNTHGNKISNSSKFTITQITLQQDGTTRSSVNVSLTIHSLMSADEGNYTCSSSNGSFSVALLSVSSPPLTNTESSTTTDSRDITTTDSRDITTTDSRDTGDTITIAAAVGSITIVIISLGILTILLVLVKIQHNKNKTLPTQNNISYCSYSANLTAEIDFYTLEPTTSISPKQVLGKTDSQDGGSPSESINISIEPLHQDVNLYQEHVSESNSTEPNLMKVVGEVFKEMLDSNPLYDRAPNKAILNKGMEDNPMYMERSQLNLCEGCMEENPIYMVEDNEHSFYTASVLDNAEPVYNKAINPHYLSHTVSGKNSNNGVITDNYDSLSPFIEPIYDIPDCKSTEPVYNKTINQENFKSDSEALSSISSSTEPVYSEAYQIR